MVREMSSPAFAPPVEALQEIDDLLEELTRITRSAQSPQVFHRELLDCAVRALGALAGAFWISEPADGWRPEVRVDQTGGSLFEGLQESSAHGVLLQTVARDPHARLVLPGTNDSGDGTPANPTDLLLLLCPVLTRPEGSPIGVLEVAQRGGASPATQQGYLRFLSALCDLAGDYHEQQQLRIWQDRAGRLGVVEQFAERAHASLDRAATAAAIANEGRRLTQSDRVSVAEFRRGKCRLLAVSGQEQVDRRANVVRRLEDLTQAVVAAGEPLWYGEQSPRLPPQISGPLQKYLDESHSQALAIIPLRAAPASDTAEASDPVGAVIVERFSGGTIDEAFRERVGSVSRQGGRALANAIEHESLPFFPLLRSWQKTRWMTQARQLPKTLLAVGAIGAAAAALALIPADFTISGQGALQPQIRREVFAGSDGLIAEVLTDHGQPCRKGETLAVLTRSQLDFESSRVQGELQTAAKRLAGVAAARLDSRPQTAIDREKYNQLAAEEEELKELLVNLEQQQGVLRRQKDELLVRSPIDGQVITWNVRELLESRPVQRGQALLSVADLSGPWVLEIEVPDDRVGHILAAQREIGPPLDVSFMLATAPGRTCHGTIEKVAMTTNLDKEQPAHVLITVAFDRAQVPQLRPGATAIPRIHCGRRALGYVWFHSVWEAVQKYVLF
ncbi:MAG: HlyD family secretion protein [Planctomycetaceae bacterium]|nr:HlyD family secretion protein [Planctomycetaceae bacterium]